MKIILLNILIILSINTFSQSYKEINSKGVYLNSNVNTSEETILILSPGSITSSTTFILPNSSGLNNQVISTLGNGSLTWTTLNVGALTPEGNNTEIQFNDASSLAASSSFSWNNSSTVLRINNSTGTQTVNVFDVMQTGNDGVSGRIYFSDGALNTSLGANSASVSVTYSLPPDFGSSGDLNVLFTNGTSSLSFGGGIQYGPTGGNDTGDNQNNGDLSYIGGGDDNDITNPSDNSTIFGGGSNQITNGSDDNASIIGGNDNQIDNGALGRVIMGGNSNALNGGSADQSGLFAGDDNSVNNQGVNSAIFAGFSNNIGGETNSAIVSGYDSQIDVGDFSFIAGGYQAYVGGENGVILGGNGSSRLDIREDYQTLLTVSNAYIDGGYAVAFYGDDLETNGNNDYRFVGGRDIYQGNKEHQVCWGRTLQTNNKAGDWVFGDSGTNQLNLRDGDNWSCRFDGGYYFYTNSGLTTGRQLTGNSWVALSDRNKKENIIEIDYSSFFEKVKYLTVYTWNYLDDEEEQRYYGPVAQSFYRLFGKDDNGLYSDSTTIGDINFTGAFISSVKGAKVESDKLDEKINDLDTKIISTNSKLDDLEKRLKKIKDKLSSKSQ